MSVSAKVKRALDWLSLPCLSLLEPNKLVNNRRPVARNTYQRNKCQLLQNLKEMGHWKLEYIGLLPISMVSLKGTGALGVVLYERLQGGNRDHLVSLPYLWFHQRGQGTLSLSVV